MKHAKEDKQRAALKRRRLRRARLKKVGITAAMLPLVLSKGAPVAYVAARYRRNEEEAGIEQVVEVPEQVIENVAFPEETYETNFIEPTQGILSEAEALEDSDDENLNLPAFEKAYAFSMPSFNISPLADIAYIGADGEIHTAPSNISIHNLDDAAITHLGSGWHLLRGSRSGNPRISTSGDVRIILEDGAHISGDGIDVNAGNSLTIYAQSRGDSAGQFIMQGRGFAAGIGATWGQGAGVIAINGGSITARGYHGAAIGGSGSQEPHYPGAPGRIYLNGGTVLASTSGRSSAIGGGGSLTARPGGGVGNIIIGGSVKLGSIEGEPTLTIGPGRNAGYQLGPSGTVRVEGSPMLIGEVEFHNDIEIVDGAKLIVNEDVVLRILSGRMLVNNGAIVLNGTFQNEGTLSGTGIFLPTHPITINHLGGSNHQDYNVSPIEQGKLVLVTVDAGRVSGDYVFSHWTSEDGIIFEDLNAPVTTFIMPDNHPVTITANWAREVWGFIDLGREDSPAAGPGWRFVNNVFTIEDGANVIITNSNASNRRRVEVASNAQNVNITLRDVTITGDMGHMAPPVAVGHNASVTINLEGNSALRDSHHAAGIAVRSGATLTIEGEGALTAIGDNAEPGIGGDNANIIINSGTITAQGEVLEQQA